MDESQAALFKLRWRSLPPAWDGDSLRGMSEHAGTVAGIGLAALGLAWGTVARADTLQLRDGASVTGRVVAEKKDQFFVDLGFTVLAVPRAEVVKASKESAPEQRPAKAAAVQESKGGTFAVATTPPPERPVRELVQSLGESVVQVRAPSGVGSGFFISEDGHLITNFHVIEGETRISVEVYHQKDSQLDRRSYKDVRIVAMNKFADLALLKVDDAGAPRFQRVLVGDTGSLSVGERVFAIGSPLGLERTVTEGILSTKTRQMGGSLYLQTTAQINPGNSGGPLFNLRGEVVGVTNMKLTFGEGLGFAIPSDELKYFLVHRDAFAYDNDNPSNPFRYLEPPGRPRAARP
jgi:serine protease Do